MLIQYHSACDFMPPAPGSGQGEKQFLLHSRGVTSIPGEEKGDFSIAGLHLNTY